MYKKFLPVLIAVSIVGLSTNAQAGDSGFYVGAGYGQSERDTGVSNLTGSASLDEDDEILKIYAGYSVNDMFAIEAHYADLGEVRLKGNTGDRFTYEGDIYEFDESVKISSDVKSYGLSGLANFQVSEMVKAFLKVGIHHWDSDTSASSPSESVSLSDDGTDIFFGVGFSVSVNEKLSIRGEIERFKIDDEDVDSFSLGVSYAF